MQTFYHDDNRSAAWPNTTCSLPSCRPEIVSAITLRLPATCTAERLQLSLAQCHAIFRSKQFMYGFLERPLLTVALVTVLSACTTTLTIPKWRPATHGLDYSAYFLIVNNNSYSAIFRKNLQARGAVHYQHQNQLDNQKSTSTINTYINIKMTKKPGWKRKKREEEAKYRKCVHRY